MIVVAVTGQMRGRSPLLTAVQLIVIITTVIALKGAIWDFFQSPLWAVNCLQHVCSSGQGTIVCKSCATHWPLSCAACRVHLGTKGQLSYLSWQSGNRIYFSFISLAETIKGATPGPRKKPMGGQGFINTYLSSLRLQSVRVARCYQHIPVITETGECQGGQVLSTHLSSLRLESVRVARCYQHTCHHWDWRVSGWPGVINTPVITETGECQGGQVLSSCTCHHWDWRVSGWPGLIITLSGALVWLAPLSKAIILVSAQHIAYFYMCNRVG